MIGGEDGPGKAFAPRFLEFAEKHPKRPRAVQSLAMALQTSGGPSGKSGVWGRAVKCLQANHVADPEVKRVVLSLARSRDEAAENFVRDVMAKNPNRKTQAMACKAAGRGRSCPQTRKNPTSSSWKLREKYSDVLPDLSGRPASLPEVLNQDIDGKPVRLSALKGKVVVLDIWATWCVPCKAMIPHEREMTGRLKDKPFVLVSISADEERKTLTEFLAKQKMPWTHWWNGHEGGIIEDWDVNFYPTIYALELFQVALFVLKGLRGEKLEEAVYQACSEEAEVEDAD